MKRKGIATKSILIVLFIIIILFIGGVSATIFKDFVKETGEKGSSPALRAACISQCDSKHFGEAAVIIDECKAACEPATTPATTTTPLTSITSINVKHDSGTCGESVRFKVYGNNDENIPVEGATITATKTDGSLTHSATTDSTGIGKIGMATQPYCGEWNIDAEYNGVTAPQLVHELEARCSGTITFTLVPDEVSAGEYSTPTVSVGTLEAGACEGKTAQFRSGSCDGAYWCLCVLGDEPLVDEDGCTATTNCLPGAETTTYYVCIDMNGNGIYESNEYATATLTVS